ncbi:MFS transporter [Salibacterium halotolerans]|uniref:MFS transporter, DHA2 family, multidrug resistance protein n=1 Tax=Salibacterium halotolerans TaxID=1884432 RepID=A0A1I5YAV5_9BACI|nr:MFS transporter [Salibacterium halotolerans]SFQ41319.1 MFS transporter, DHA2 family, multidrug resistance protein [Salibacterium halotolerans]
MMTNTGNDQSNIETPDMTTNAPPRAGWKEWIGLAVLGLPTLLLSLDFTMLHLALPHLAADLNPSSTQQLWILDIYGFMIAGFLVTMGPLSDRLGRRRLLMIGASAFGAISLLAAFSISAEMLIVTRALLGIAGATLMPSTIALISNMFKDPKQRTMAISLWMVCFAAGGVLGPVVGGVLLNFFWWGSVFLLGVPVMVLLLLTAPLLLPEYRNPQAGRLDLISVALSLGAILPVIYGVKEIARNGWQVSPVFTVVAGAAIGWIFMRRQNRLGDPLVDLELFKNRTFSGALGMLLLGMITISGFVLLFAQYLQLVEGLASFQASLWMIPYAVGSFIGIMVAPITTRWIPPSYVISIGLVIASAGFMMITQVDVTSGLTIPVIGSVLLTIGIGPMQVLTMDIII